MVFLPVIAVALVAGLLLGGDPAKLSRLSIRRSWLFFTALAIQVVAFPTAQMPWSVPDRAASALWLVSYALLIAAALSNRAVTGMSIMAAGLGLNLAAILVNGGHMPVLPSALAAEGRSYDVHSNSIQLAQPHLAGFVDRWAVPGWIPFGNVFSVGDVTIALGACIVVLAALEPRFLRRKRAPAVQQQNELREDAGLLGIGSQGGRRALVVPAGGSNVLWDCVPLLGDDAVRAVQERGGLRAIAVPHAHTAADAMAWSEAFGGIPVYVHADDSAWVRGAGECVEFWEGETLDLGDGLTLVRCGGGDVAGGQVLHAGTTLYSGDIVQVIPDRSTVSFLSSYPTPVAPDPVAVGRIVAALEPFAFDRIVGAWWGLEVPAGGKAIVRRSAQRLGLALAA